MKMPSTAEKSNRYEVNFNGIGEAYAQNIDGYFAQKFDEVIGVTAIHHVIDGERHLVSYVSGCLGSSPGFVADVVRVIRLYIDNKIKQSTAKQDTYSDISKQNTSSAWFELSEISSALKLQADGIQTLITLMSSSEKGEGLDGFCEGLVTLLEPIRMEVYKATVGIDAAVREIRGNLSQ